MLRRFSAIATALVTLSLIMSASAQATALPDPYEPNDTMVTAFGPLAASTDYVGAINLSYSDEDWFVFYVKDRQRITASVTSGRGVEVLVRGGIDSEGMAYDNTPWTWDRTLDRGTYYIGLIGPYGGSNGPDFAYSLRVTTDGELTNRNEIEALNNRDADIGEVNHYAGQVRSLAGLVHNSQADVKRKTTALRHAHGRNAINRARHSLDAAKHTLASRQRSLKSAQGTLRLWQSRLNTANQQVIQYG